MPSDTVRLRLAPHCAFVDDLASGRVLLQHNARPGLRPYIHPLRLADGRTCLTEDSPWHHPWQHGIQTGFHGVNGCDFWLDPGQHPDLLIGTIDPSPPRALAQDSPVWEVEALWRHAQGQTLLLETQQWAWGETDGLDCLDLRWTLLSLRDVTIEQHAYGGLFVRMPFRRHFGAQVLNGNGQQDDETEQQAAAWVDLYMPLESSGGGGIAVLDHPTNPGHPVHWRVDGQRGINPAPCISGAITLPVGTVMGRRYRLILHPEPLAPSRLEALWQAYEQA